MVLQKIQRAKLLTCMIIVTVRDENPDVPGVTIDGPQTMSATEGQAVTLRCETQGMK